MKRPFKLGVILLATQLLSAPTIAECQTIYKGSIYNLRTNETIPYATVGLQVENIGINADKNGYFELKSLKSLPNDTLIVSCLGYKVSKIGVNNISSEKTIIRLIEHSIKLSEITISNKSENESDILNKFFKCDYTYTFSYTQLAQHFQAKQTNSKLVGIKICQTAFGNENKMCRYRLRVYSMDSITKAPLYDLYDKIIEIKVKNKVTLINLKKYNINIPCNDFFIAVEWLLIPENEVKDTSKNSGSIKYLPIIGRTQRTNKTLEYWELNYQNKWNPYTQSTLLMQAIIKN